MSEIDNEQAAAGWYDDPERPGIQRYWQGDSWATDIAPRGRVELQQRQPVWKQARPIALGILVAIAAVWFVYNLNQPSDTDCLIQQTEVLTGERAAVESACVGRP